MGLYSLPSSQSAMPVRPSSRGLPETLILTTKTPTKETAVPRLVQSENFYYPTILVSTASEPVSTDSPYFNEGLVSEVQNTNRQTIPKALALTYKDYDTVPVTAYSSFHIPKKSQNLFFRRCTP